MNVEELLKRIIRLTAFEEKWLRTTLKAGQDWVDYYKGEHTVIRTDKLALLMKDRATLRKFHNPTTIETPQHCSKCGTPIKTMPCDEELTYCPRCDLDHEY